MPGEPAASMTAARHLCVSGGRAGTHPATSAASTTPTRAPDTSRPMSAAATAPASARPGWNSSPGFSAANVTVRVAATGGRRPGP